jgi:hypothetical protein
MTTQEQYEKAVAVYNKIQDFKARREMPQCEINDARQFRKDYRRLRKQIASLKRADKLKQKQTKDNLSTLLTPQMKYSKYERRCFAAEKTMEMAKMRAFILNGNTLDKCNSNYCKKMSQNNYFNNVDSATDKYYLKLADMHFYKQTIRDKILGKQNKENTLNRMAKSIDNEIIFVGSFKRKSNSSIEIVNIGKKAKL